MTELKFGGASGDAPPPVAREVNYEQEPPNGEVEGSLLHRLRTAAAKQQEVNYQDFVVGGSFGKQLWIRYKPLDPEPMDQFITRRADLRRIQDEDPAKGLPFTSLNMDLMAQACVAVIGANPEGENKEILKDEVGTLRLEHRLIAYLSLPVPPDGRMLTAREVILMLFGNNAMAIVDHGDQLVDWMQDPSAQPSAGES